MFHVNREIEKGVKCSMSKLSKVFGDQKVVISDKKEIERISVDFFSKLFQGHHRSDGTIKDLPFTPDFSKLGSFLEDVGKLNSSERDVMIQSVTLYAGDTP